MDAWKKTKLWLAIDIGARDAVALTIENAMPLAEAILAKSETAPPDFTLHDEDHSFRVAERIHELLEPCGIDNFSRTELAQLLLAAYLHDIGMMPRRDRYDRHFRYIVTGEEGLLSPLERQELQQWLDADMEGIEPPIDRIKTSSEGLRIADQAITYYARYRHNDWSEEWIRENLFSIRPGLYTGWQEDLITLCKSHHEGLNELRTSRFDAKLAGSPGECVNIRYLAALLRLADILEFDPERTPEIILNHRDISPGSRIYWHKDKQLSFKLNSTSYDMFLSARTDSAILHKALLDTVAAVNAELSVCNTLNHEGAFKRGIVPEADRLRYKWPWPSEVTCDIREANNTFVFIDGAFRPSPVRVIQLLSGTALYGTPLAAIRELLQNAFDAIREQIAYERLEEMATGTLISGSNFGDRHVVQLKIELDGEDLWLRCIDDGTGMTKAIIEQHLLVSGSGIKPESRSLERMARDKGFGLDRTGKFGIGVLSYFMIADRLELTSRRSPEAHDRDGTAWHFTTNGLAGFGELTRTPRSSRGTEVKLRIKPEVWSDDKKGWATEVKNYVLEALNWIPCRFQFIDEINDSQILCNPGWIEKGDHLSDKALYELRKENYSSDDVYTEYERSVMSEEEGAWQAIRDGLRDKLEWRQSDTKSLPNANGEFRVVAPVFKLEAGASIRPYLTQAGRIIPMPDGRICQHIRPYTFRSWRGFSIFDKEGDILFSRYHGNYAPFFFTQIDIRNSGEISVSRNDLKDYSFDENRKAVRALSSEFIMKLSNEFHDSPLLQLDRYCLQASGYLNQDCPAPSQWLAWDEANETLSFVDINKGVDVFSTGTQSDHPAPYKNDIRLPLFARVVDDEYGEGLRPSLASYSGNIAVVKSPGHVRVVATNLKPGPSSTTSRGHKFPSDWKHVLGISVRGGFLLNERWCKAPISTESTCSAHSGPVNINRFLSSYDNPKSALEYVIENSAWPISRWEAIQENHPNEYKNLIGNILVDGYDTIVIAILGYNERVMALRFSQDGVEMAASKRAGGLDIPQFGLKLPNDDACINFSE